jgi:uncharacterized protein YndB with AHSA1/START domain
VPVAGLALHLERELPATRPVVFGASTDPELLARWWGPTGFTAPEVDVDLRVGGHYRIAMQPPEGDPFHLAGEFVVVERPARLCFSFRWEEPDPDDRETVVDLGFDDQGGSTVLRIDQGHFATEARRALHEEGWSQSLDRLEALLATGPVS